MLCHIFFKNAFLVKNGNMVTFSKKIQIWDPKWPPIKKFYFTNPLLNLILHMNQDSVETRPHYVIFFQNTIFGQKKEYGHFFQKSPNLGPKMASNKKILLHKPPLKFDFT